MGTDATRAEAFSNRLATLKRDGCAVLVRGDPRGADVVCDRLLGEPGLDRRHVFVSTANPERALDRYEPREVSASRLGLVDASSGRYTRSAAAASGHDAGTLPDRDATPAWRTTVEDRADFPAVLAAVEDHVDRLLPVPGAAAPGELRLCLDNLDALLDAVDGDEATREELFTFLHLLTTQVRERDGIAHVHVATGVSDELVALYEPLFDATVEAETQSAGTVRQKWRLHDSGLESAWLTLD